jgi:hypothetical protein
MAYGTDAVNLSDVTTELLIEQYGGEVESQFAKSSIMREFVKIRPVRNTDTITNNRVGRTTLQKLVPGARPDAIATNFGKVSLTVDTVILSRDSRSMLNEFQAHFDARIELAQDHGKEIGKFFDQAFIILAIKGAGQSAPAGLNNAFGAGKSTTLAAAGDELDPDKLYTAITGIITTMEEEDIDVSDLLVFVRPKQFEVLKNNNKLMSRDFSAGNGDYAKGMLYEINGARIVKTARIPTAAISGHLLSNPNNGNAYDVSATEAKAVAVILHPKSLLAGETIPLTSDVWFNKEEKLWFIDSFLSFAVTVNRPDVCGRVLRF